MDNNIIDYGIWNTPKSWDDVTLDMFQRIEKYYSDKDKNFDLREVLEIFTDHNKEEIDQLPIEFAEKLMNELAFLKEQPQYGDASPKIEIDGEEYVINVMEKLKTGEFIAVDTVLKGDSYNYAAILAILCRKEGEIYDSKFEAETFDKRYKMFASQPIIKVMPLVSFFLSLCIIRKAPFLLYSEVEEEINRIQQSIDNSVKLGVFKKRSLNLQMKKLKKLLKSSKNI